MWRGDKEISVAVACHSVEDLGLSLHEWTELMMGGVGCAFDWGF